MQSSAVATAATATAPPMQAARAAGADKSTPLDDDDEAWRAVLGPGNPDYYLERFADARATGGGVGLSWHWPAFFVTWYWLLYRKMWGWSIFYLFFPFLAAAIGGVLASFVKSGAAALLPGLAYLFALFAAPPMLANALYYRHCMGLLRSQRASASRERYLARLEARGGTSNIAVIIIGIFGLVALVGVLPAIAMPAYQDYTKRAKVTELVNGAMAVAHGVGEQYEQTGLLPRSLDALPNKPALPRFVESMEINPRSGVIEIVTTLAPSGASASVYLVPTADPDRHLTWSCKAAPAMVKLLPRSCRADEN